MKYIIKHFNTINRHRWEVFKLCVKVHIPFRGLVHDLSKFSYEEFSEGVKYYKKSNGKYSPIVLCKKDLGYSRAWLHHKGRNKHHFEYWYDLTAPEPTPIIPFKYMLEMICDRIGASKTYNRKNYKNSDVLDYFYKEEPYMTLNDNLKRYLEHVFKELKDNGEKVINKKHLYELYLKYTKKAH